MQRNQHLKLRLILLHLMTSTARLLIRRQLKKAKLQQFLQQNTAATVNYKSDNKHEVTTYSWPEVSAATADTTYTEVATKAEEKCNITYAETSKHTLVSGTVLTGTCTVCKHVDTQTKDDKLDGTAYYAALDAAKAVDWF